MSLIEQRHPAFAQLMAVWRLGIGDATLPTARMLAPNALASVGQSTVLLASDSRGGELTIAESGSEVDALYGVALAGAPAARLSPERDDALREAQAAIETGRPLLVEDEVATAGCRRRIARLYLPLANDDGSPDGVLCGVVAVA